MGRATAVKNILIDSVRGPSLYVSIRRLLIDPLDCDV